MQTIKLSFFTWLTKQYAIWRNHGNGDSLEQGAERTNAGTTQIAPIPRVIWILWLQGWEQAPEIVRACLTTWRRHNPEWTIHTLTASNLHEFLDEDIFSPIQDKDLEPEAFSDIIRLSLLQRYGGVWVDSTLYCLRPLRDWLYEKIYSSGFFAFDKPGKDRMLSSWFLAASKGNYIVQRWYDLTRKYWLDRDRRDDYFWVHRLFEDIYNADEHFRSLWDAVEKISANGPHCYLPYKQKLYRSVSSEDQSLLGTASSPVLKLTHKLAQVEYPTDSVLRYLCDRANDQPNDVIPFHDGRTVSVSEVIQIDDPPDVLVTWYGSFDGHGTIGDLLSMYSVTSHLVCRGHRVLHASAANIHVDGAQRVDWSVVSPEQFDVLIFVCGPILKNHPQSQLLFERFRTCRKLGVSVSMFPPGHSNYTDPFDQVLAREGKSTRYEDIAIVAPRTIPHRQRTLPDREVSIGVVLRGPQSEYGVERCLWEKTEEIIDQVTKTIIAERDGRIVKIENHLRRSGLTPLEIEAQYSNCDLVISSRFHGGMLAARHGIPFIAIDQIKGGAKVSTLLGRTGWPHLFQADSANAMQVVRSALQLLAGDFNKMLLEVRDRAIQRANVTLLHMDNLLRTQLHRTDR